MAGLGARLPLVQIGGQRQRAEARPGPCLAADPHRQSGGADQRAALPTRYGAAAQAPAWGDGSAGDML